MGLLLKKEDGLIIQVLELNNFQLAEIVSWKGYEYYKGRVVVRYDNTLVDLTSQDCWYDIKNILTDPMNIVRILEKGEKLEIS